MVRFYSGEGSTFYDYLTIKKIIPYSDRTYLHCSGKRFFKDLKNPSGYKTEYYYIRVKVEGYLREYVDFELNPDDLIFIVGHLGNSKAVNNGNLEIGALIVADAIMKPTYLNYYPNREIGER